MPVRQRVLIGQAQVLLGVKGVAPQTGVVKVFNPFQLGGFEAALVLVGPVKEDDGLRHVFGYHHRIGKQHVHPHGGRADGLSGGYPVYIVQMALPACFQLAHLLAGGFRVPGFQGILGHLQRVQPA